MTSLFEERVHTSSARTRGKYHRVGALIDYTIRLWGIRLRWKTRIAVWQPGVRFVDEQLSGPYKSWVHTHRLASANGGTDIEDEVVYELPFGLAGQLVAPLIR